MKIFSYLLVPALLLTSGCSTYVSNGYDYGYGHHRSHVSVGVHGHSSGAAVLGALIVGGIVGSIITDAKNKEEAKQHGTNDEGLGKTSSQKDTQDELVNGYSVDNSQPMESQEYQAAVQSNESKIQWYQYGKDGNCYLMGIEKGVTDVISAVPANQCKE